MTNMETSYWYDTFIEALYEKYPKKTHLAQELMELLSIEREAAYRRLRKDVNFSFQEIAKIASKWDISLDRLISANQELIPFQMRLINFLSPTEKDINFIQTRIQFINYVKKTENSEWMDVCNKLPKSLLAGFKNLYRFDLFRWSEEYDSGNEEGRLFSEIIIPAKLQKLMTELFQAVKDIASVNYIWDQMLLDYLVRDIRYFHSIRMLTDDEKELIKQDLYDLLDYLFEIVSKGYFPETKNEVNFYISRISINTNYTYLHTKEVKTSRIHVFGKYEIYSYDPEVAGKFRTWMQSKKKSSYLISKVDKKERIDFFAKQRQLIDNL